MADGSLDEWEPALLRSAGEAASLVMWTWEGQPRFRLRVLTPGMTVNNVARRLAMHIEERLADSADDVFDGADAASLVMLRSDGQVEVGRGWLNAPDDHIPADMRPLAQAALDFLRT
jgi:hypothetical protein